MVHVFIREKSLVIIILRVFAKLHDGGPLIPKISFMYGDDKKFGESYLNVNFTQFPLELQGRKIPEYVVS